MVEATIDLAALCANARSARELAPHSRQLAVIKANAYGHGLLAAARALEPLADGLGVARAEEAFALRDAGIDAPLVVMSERPDRATLAELARRNVALTVFDRTVAETLNAGGGARMNIWLKIDTGMHRIGIMPDEVADTLAVLRASDAVGDIVLMSHFAAAEELERPLNDAQLACFDRAVAGTGLPASLANSAAVIALPESHRDWVRPGIMLYGANPFDEEHAVRLQPVMTLTAPVIAVRTIGTGESVGYHGIWTSARPSRIATIGIGYGDGYPRHAPNGTPVLIRGRVVPTAGRVSMDMVTVDVTDHPEIEPGDTATLWGEGLPIERVARAAGTIPYELLTKVTSRVRFRYRDASDAQ